MLTKNFILFTFISISILICGCAKDNPVVMPVPKTTGVLVLCEGTFTIPGDFSIIDPNSGTVSNNVYSNANNGATLGATPDGMYIISPNIFITSQGNFGGPGKMFKIDYNTYKLISTSNNFGVNPYDLDEAGGNLYVTNTDGSTVSELDLNMNPNGQDIQVGPNPSKIIFALQSLYVAKQSYTTENTLSIINEFSHIVTKDTFPAPPVSVENIIGYVYVSTYSWKKLYVLDSLSSIRKADSTYLNIPSAAIGEMVSDGSHTLYIVGFPSLSAYAGNVLYKYNTLTNQIDQSFQVQIAAPDDIYGLAFDPINKIIYIASSNAGNNGNVLTYNTNGTFIKSYPLGNKYPRKIVFKTTNG